MESKLSRLTGSLAKGNVPKGMGIVYSALRNRLGTGVRTSLQNLSCRVRLLDSLQGFLMEQPMEIVD